MEIRRCSSVDVEQIETVWPGAGAVARSHVREQSSGASIFLIAWIDEAACGWIVMHLNGCLGENSRDAFPHAIELIHLQVRPGLRGRGIGTALIREAEDMSRACGSPIVAVSVDLGNEGARRLYERLGYRPTGVMDDSTYNWIGTDGSIRQASETHELLVKALR